MIKDFIEWFKWMCDVDAHKRIWVIRPRKLKHKKR